MKKTHSILTTMLLAALLNSCGNLSSTREERAMSETAPQSESRDDNGALASSSLAISTNDSIKKISKTADLRFKSKDAVKTTYTIEDITKRNGGIIESSEIQKLENHKRTVQTSRDSALEIIRYTLESTITLRVPEEKLDTTLKEIALYIDYLSNRSIKAEDLTLKFLKEKIEQQSALQSKNRIDSLQQRKKGNLDANLNAEDARYTRQLHGDAARLQQMELDDKVKYSTVNLSIYEDAKEYKTNIPYLKSITAYKSDFGLRFINALNNGWNIFIEFVLVLTSLWWLIFLIFATIFSIRYFVRRKRTK